MRRNRTGQFCSVFHKYQGKLLINVTDLISKDRWLYLDTWLDLDNLIFTAIFIGKVS